MRPSDRYRPALDHLALALVPIADAAKLASELDRQSCDYALEALTRAAQWVRDHTETSRRNASANAAASQALALAPVVGRGSPLRHALAAYAGAVQSLIEGDTVRAIATADAALLRLA